MYTFEEQNSVGKEFESLFTSLLDEKQIRWLPNPDNGTANAGRAYYDLVILPDTLIEIKANPAAQRTGNICLEVDILAVSKSDYFIIFYPVYQGWDARVLTQYEIYQLLCKGYREVPAGQYQRLSALIPVEDLKFYGFPLTQFINHYTVSLAA